MTADKKIKLASPSQARAKKRGFTLTEIAIVLGIIGIILGAIWVAAAAVYNNMRISAANRELLQITQAVRAMYATSSAVDPTANMPINAAPAAGGLTYIKAGVFPSDALDLGVASTATRTVNPWSGFVTIAADTNPATGAANDSFYVDFDAIPSQACINLLMASTGQGRDPGMWNAGGGAAGGLGTPSTTPLPMIASAAEDDCKNDSNAATFWFSLRASN